MAKDNRSLGRFHLDGIMPAPRGIPQVEVTLDIDANGILSVSAKDKATGKENKIRIEGGSQLSKDEINRMKEEAEANAESDKLEREKADKVNQADALIFQTEKQLKEFSDKLTDDDKKNLQSALEDLKKAHSSKEIEQIDETSKKLNDTWSTISTRMYQESASNESNNTDSSSGNENGDVEDTSYEEVK
jgi:molecular chaperone DnaK